MSISGAGTAVGVVGMGVKDVGGVGMGVEEEEETLSLVHLWRRIPDDVFMNNIMPFANRSAPKLLLDDIRSFHKTRQILDKKYNKHTDIENRHNVIHCIVDDLFQCANEGISLGRRIAPHFIAIFRRHRAFTSRSKKQITSMIYNKFDKDDYATFPPHKQVKILWGLFTPQERRCFIISDDDNDYDYLASDNEDDGDDEEDEEDDE